MSDAIRGDGRLVILSIQSALFVLFAVSLDGKAAMKTFFLTGFVFVLTSQIYLLSANGWTLPAIDLDGFFVTRRTIHSLFLGFFTLGAIHFIANRSM
ncbi:MAG: hypothetical protein O9272_12560, partial [Brevundimonas sp.]|nr:hypothetical protein [Brevundimonas sp.]